MNRSRFDANTTNSAHEGTILASDVLPPGFPAPFSHAWGYLAGKGEMGSHSHPTQEVYLFFKGEGVVVVGGVRGEARPGDVVHIPPNAEHTVVNESDGELLWAALWWGA